MVAITKKEKQQIEHHAKTDDEIERAAPYAQCLCRYGLGGSGKDIGQLPHCCRRVVEPEVIQNLSGPGGQDFQNALQVKREVQFPRLDPVINAGCLAPQRGADQVYRQDHHGENQKNSNDCRQVLPISGGRAQTQMQWIEYDRRSYAPQDCSIEWLENPEEGCRYRDKQKYESRVFDLLHFSGYENSPT